MRAIDRPSPDDTFASAVHAVLRGLLLMVATPFLVIYALLIPDWYGFAASDWLWLALGLAVVLASWLLCAVYLARKARRVVVPLVAVLMCCLAAYQLELFDYSFDSDTWKRAAYLRNFGRRYRMTDAVGRLIDEGTIASSDDAVQHLGPPERRHGRRRHVWLWCLGPDRGLIVLDDAWFALEFDEEGGIARHFPTIG